MLFCHNVQRSKSSGTKPVNVSQYRMLIIEFLLRIRGQTHSISKTQHSHQMLHSHDSNVVNKNQEPLTQKFQKPCRPRAQVLKISEILQQRRVQLLGHILRQPESHPLRVVSCKRHSVEPFEILYRRVGRPRKRWMDISLKLAWEEIRPDNNEFSLAQHQLIAIQQAAENLQLWFSFPYQGCLDIDPKSFPKLLGETTWRNSSSEWLGVLTGVATSR